ncbi:MAG: hypothetical protein JRI22_10670 [Deltaproteobacteria bacterium]|nr:hypothetical protein [Deltaproteobacteria bacterium]
MMRKTAFFVAALLMMSGTAFAQTIPVPTSQQMFSYPPTADPVLDADPAAARPVGVGSVAAGGLTLTLRISFLQFSGPVDIYFLIASPVGMFYLRSDGTFQPFSGEIEPLKSNTTGPIDENLFGDVPTSALPPGTYFIYCAAASPGSLERFYAWETYFEIQGPGPANGCGDYTGSRQFSMSFDHTANADVESFHEQIRTIGSVPFTLQADGTLTGEGTIQVSISGQADVCTFSGTGTVHVTISGQLSFDETCAPMLNITFNEIWYQNTIVTWVCPEAVVPVNQPTENVTHNLTFPVINGHTISGPVIAPGASGTYSWTLYVQ